MEDRVKLFGRPSAGDRAARFNRRHRIDKIIEVQTLRAIDRTGIADCNDIRAIGHGSTKNCHRRQAAAILQLNKRQVIARRISNDFSAIAGAALRWHDTDDDGFFLSGNFNHMGVCDNLVRRNRKAAAMANKRNLITVCGGQHNADDRSTGSRDIGGISMSRCCR